MDCWPVNGERSITMCSFLEKEVVYASAPIWPCDQLLPNQQELSYGAANNTTPPSSWEQDGSFPFNQEESGFKFESLPIQMDGIDEEWPQKCGFELESLPIQMQGFDDFQFIPMLDSHDEDYGYSELNLPAWHETHEPTISELCCGELFAEQPRNNSFYTLEHVMAKLPMVSPILSPSPPMSPGILPSPQFSSDVCSSSCLLFSGRVSCPQMNFAIPPSPQLSSNVSFSSGRVSCSPALLQSNEAETEHLSQLTQLQSCRKPHEYPSVEPQSIAARHRRSKIREKIRSLEKLIPQGSKLDTARMLDEAIKYLKFLKAQVQVLEDYADSKPRLKPDPNSADDIANSCLKQNFKSEYALAMQRSDSAAASSNISDQMLHTLLSSSRIQKQLFSAGKIIVTSQQKEKFASTRPDLSCNFSDLFVD